MADEQPGTPAKKVSAPEKGKKPRRRRGGKFLNFLLLLGIIAAIALFVWAEQQRREAIGQLEQTEQELEQIRQSTERSQADVAAKVLENVSKLIDIPLDPQPTVATIIDVERLRETNDFYNQAENGDNLIITQRRAILYDPDRNLILDVVPVRIDATQQQQDQNQDQTEGDQQNTEETGESPAPEQQETPSPEAGQ